MGTIIHPGTAREVITEGQPVLLGLNDINDLIWAIQLAYVRIEEDVKVVTDTAASLRAGESIWPFADGETGAAAAESILRNFTEGRERLNALHDLLNNCDNLIAIDLNNVAVA